MLLGTAFLHLIPHALEYNGHDNVTNIMSTVLAAICAFFLLEKGLIWRHHHHGDDDLHSHASHARGAMILVGDSVHNFVDGTLVTAAFLTDVKLGVLTAIAVIAHEIPQELGDFALLVESGFSRTKAFVFNAVSAFMMVVGALVGFFAIHRTEVVLPFFLAFAAASFIYIAVADLMPALNRRVGRSAAVSQFVLLTIGIAFTAISHYVFE